MTEWKPTRRYRVQATGTTNTYVYRRIAARDALERAEAVQTGALYFCMMAGVFASFTVEAFLNHLGQKRVRDWESLEKKLGPWEKLLVIRQILSLSVDVQYRPFQTLKDVLLLRNELAHGKTVTKKFDEVKKTGDWSEVKIPEPKWKKHCTVIKAKRIVEDANAIVIDLHKQSVFLGIRSSVSEMGHVLLRKSKTPSVGWPGWSVSRNPSSSLKATPTVRSAMFSET